MKSNLSEKIIWIGRFILAYVDLVPRL